MGAFRWATVPLNLFTFLTKQQENAQTISSFLYFYANFNAIKKFLPKLRMTVFFKSSKHIQHVQFKSIHCIYACT